MSASPSTSSSPDAPASSVLSANFSLVTLNCYLFAYGLRHSRQSAEKDRRAADIIRLIQGRTEEAETSSQLEESTNKEDDIDGTESDGLLPGPVSNGSSARRRNAASLASPSARASQSVPRPISSSSFAATPSFLSADIVCLQEVIGSLWCKKWRNLFLSSLPGAGYTVLPSPRPLACCASRGLSRLHVHVCDAGLLVATRLPVVSSRFVSFENNPWHGALAFCDKGFQHIVLDLRGRAQQGHRGDGEDERRHGESHGDRQVNGVNSSPESASAPVAPILSPTLSPTAASSTSSVSNPPSHSSSRPRARAPFLLHLIHTHLHSPEGSGEVGGGPMPRSSLIRVKQVAEIADYLKKQHRHADADNDDSDCMEAPRFDPATSAMIMVGDLNAQIDEEECHTFRQLLQSPNISFMPPSTATTHSLNAFCNHGEGRHLACDWALGTRAVQFQRTTVIQTKEAARLSDHYPVRMEINVKQMTATSTK